MKKILNLLIITILILSSCLSVNADNNGIDLQKEEYFKSIENLKIKHTKGIKLSTKTFYKEENNKLVKYINKGVNIKAKIKIKDFVLKGNLSESDKTYILKGDFNKETGKFEGQVTNYATYHFEAYVNPDDLATVSINIFDDKDEPKTYIVNGRTASVKKVSDIKLDTNKVYSKTNVESTLNQFSLTGGADYWDNLGGTISSGIELHLFGPKSPNSNPYIQARVNTDVSDAWDDTLLAYSGYLESEYVDRLEITFSPDDSASVFKKYDPSSNSDTTISLSIPFYTSTLGWQTIGTTFTTSSTTVQEINGSDVYVKYDYNLATGYLSEGDDSIEYRANNGDIFTAEVQHSSQYSGDTCDFNVYAKLQYSLTVKDTMGFYTSAYPEYDISMDSWFWNYD